MDCPNISECQLLKLKEDLGLIILDKDYEIGSETIEQVSDRFAGIEPMCLVRDEPFIGLGRLYFRGVFLCDTLENPDYLMPLGCYRLDNTYSPKFKKFLPEIMIPKHTGVRIHAANTVKDLRGCVGVGIRLSSGALLSYSTITLERVQRVIKDLNIRYFRFN